MVEPVRLQISRKKGFNLQEHSRSVNGLPAVNCARPSRWGNPVSKSDFEIVNAALEASGRPPLAGTWRHHAVKCFDAWLGGEIPELGTPPTMEEIERGLRGHNLACWCPLDGEPCHCDVLLGLANS